MPVGAEFSSAYAGGRNLSCPQEGVGRKRLWHCSGDEGGYAPNLKSNQEALDVIMEAINQAGL